MFEMFVSNSSVSPEILELLLSSWYREVLKQHQGHGFVDGLSALHCIYSVIQVRNFVNSHLAAVLLIMLVLPPPEITVPP